MPFDTELASRIREYLALIPGLNVEEKKMFRGMTFMVNGKMCVGVSADNLMCRYDPALQDDLSARPGYLPMLMKNRLYKGYCYVAPAGIKSKKNLVFWIDLCLAFNKIAKASKKSK